MRKLTTAEEELMQYLWILNHATVNDILEQIPEPKPAYNTVSTIIKILEKKGFVSHKTIGKTYLFSPLFSKKEYAKFHFTNFVNDYFNNSTSLFASFFIKDNNLTVNEIDDILKIIHFNQKESEKE
jgi:predicted transcriptional regulator